MPNTHSLTTRPTRLIKLKRVDGVWCLWLFTTQQQPQQQHTVFILHDNGRLERQIEQPNGTMDVFVIEEGCV